MIDPNVELAKSREKARKVLKTYKNYKFKDSVALPPRVKLTDISTVESASTRLVPNTAQQEMVDLYNKGDSFTILGAAGSGKTTMAVQMIKDRIEDLPKTWALSPQFYADNEISTKHKYIKEGLPGFLVVTFTNRAGETAARALDLNIQVNQYNANRDAWESLSFTGEDFCNTAHATVAYQLVDVTVKKKADNGETVELKSKAFKATRGLNNKLCPNIVSILIDEAGMLAITYLKELFESIWLDRTQVVMMGDLSQLPAVGETSALIASLGVSEQVKLTETWRFGGILLDWNTKVREKSLVIPKASEPRQWIETDNAGDHINHMRTMDSYHIVDKKNRRAIYNFFFTKAEAKNSTQALKKVCKVLTQYIITGKFCVGIDLVIIPQHVGVMGGASIMRVVNSWLDHYYGRQNYLLNYSSGKAVIAVGDVMHYRREQCLLVGIEQTPDYKGTTSQSGELYSTRDADVWIDLQDANQNQTLDTDLDSMIEHFSLESSADLAISEAALETIDAQDLDSDYSESVPRQLSHTLLILDLSKLFLHLSMKYSKEDSYRVAKNFVDLVTKLSINLDSKQKDINVRYGHLRNIEKQINIIAEFYNLTEWVQDNLKIIKSSNEFPSMGNKPGYQEGYFTGYQVQGSECPKIFSVAHRKGYRSNMTSNEFIYTSDTRATSVIINMYDERLLDGTLAQGGINYQTYPGITIEEKQATYMKLASTKIPTPTMEYVLDKLAYLTELNQYKKGGKWWDEPKFSIKYTSNVS